MQEKGIWFYLFRWASRFSECKKAIVPFSKQQSMAVLFFRMYRLSVGIFIFVRAYFPVSWAEIRMKLRIYLML